MSFIDNLEKKLKKIDKLNNISDNIHNNIIDNIINNKNYDNLDQINKINIKNQYYNSLPQYKIVKDKINIEGLDKNKLLSKVNDLFDGIENNTITKRKLSSI